jgi:hypothetical protein
LSKLKHHTHQRTLTLTLPLGQTGLALLLAEWESLREAVLPPSAPQQPLLPVKPPKSPPGPPPS